jgi:hypothetical protein
MGKIKSVTVIKCRLEDEQIKIADKLEKQKNNLVLNQHETQLRKSSLWFDNLQNMRYIQ